MTNESIPIASPKPAVSAAQRAAARTQLLLHGPVIATLLRLGPPNVVVNVVLIAVTASVDAHFIGRFGPNALAGISLVFPLIMLMQQVANSSMGGAIAAAVARAIGAGRRGDASALVIHGVIVAAGLAAIFASVLLIGGPAIYRLIGGSGEVLEAALEYSNALFAGSLAYWMLSTLTSVVRGAGHAFVLAVVYVAAEALHIVLVPILMFGMGPIPALGITGAGIATVSSFTASTLFLAWYIASGRTAVELSFRGVRLTRRLFVEILRVGLPMMLQPSLNNVGLAFLTAYVGSLGAAQLAGFGVASRLEYILYPLTFGVDAGLIAIVGTNLGAGNYARVVRASWIGAGLAALITGCIGLYALIAPGTWASLFTDDAEVSKLAAQYLIVIALTYPFLGAGLTLASAFQAAGRPEWAVVGITGRVTIVIVGGWIAVHFLGGGLQSLALVAGAGLLVYGTIEMTAFRAGKWRPPASLADSKSS